MQPAAHPPTIYSLPSPSSASPTELCSIVIPEQEERLCLCGQPAPRGTPGRRHTPHQLSPEAPQLRGAGRRWCNPETLHCVARRSSRPVWPARARSRPGPRTSSSSSPTASPLPAPPPRPCSSLSLSFSPASLSCSFPCPCARRTDTHLRPALPYPRPRPTPIHLTPSSSHHSHVNHRHLLSVRRSSLRALPPRSFGSATDAATAAPLTHGDVGAAGNGVSSNYATRLWHGPPLPTLHLPGASSRTVSPQGSPGQGDMKGNDAGERDRQGGAVSGRGGLAGCGCGGSCSCVSSSSSMNGEAWPPGRHGQQAGGFGDETVPFLGPLLPILRRSLPSLGRSLPFVGRPPPLLRVSPTVLALHVALDLPLPPSSGAGSRGAGHAVPGDTAAPKTTGIHFSAVGQWDTHTHSHRINSCRAGAGGGVTCMYGCICRRSRRRTTQTRRHR